MTRELIQNIYTAMDATLRATDRTHAEAAETVLWYMVGHNIDELAADLATDGFEAHEIADILASLTGEG